MLVTSLMCWAVEGPPPHTGDMNMLYQLGRDPHSLDTLQSDAQPAPNVFCAIQCKQKLCNLFHIFKNLLCFYTAHFVFLHLSYFFSSGVFLQTHMCLRSNPLSSKTSCSISSTICYYCHESRGDFPLFSCTCLKQLHCYLLIRGIN